MTKSLHINLYAGPGVGKSITAASLFVNLKRQGIHAELVTEAAKDHVYAGTIQHVTQDELFEEQHRRQALYQGKVQVVITDAPLALSLAYLPEEAQASRMALIERLTGHWDQIHVLLHRDFAVSGYEPAGRYQSQAEAATFHSDVVVPMVRKAYPQSIVESDVDFAVELLALLVRERLKR